MNRSDNFCQWLCATIPKSFNIIFEFEMFPNKHFLSFMQIVMKYNPDAE